MQHVRPLLQSEFYLCAVWRTQHASRSDLGFTIYATMCLSHCTPLDVHMKWTMDIARPHNRQPQDHTAHNSLSWKQTNTIRELISLDADSHICGPKRAIGCLKWFGTQFGQKFQLIKKAASVLISIFLWHLLPGLRSGKKTEASLSNFPTGDLGLGQNFAKTGFEEEEECRKLLSIAHY